MAEPAPDPEPAPPKPLFGVFHNCTREVEFKFYADPAELDAFEHSAWVGALATAGVRSRQRVTEYYDTPDHALQRAGYRLRLRTGGANRVLSAKRRIWAGGGLFRRLEWKLPVGANQGIHDLIPANEDMARLGIRPRDLGLVFTTHIARTSRKLCFASAANGPQVQVLLEVDRGLVVTPAAQAQISEAEFELLEGPETELVHFADAARRRFKLTPGLLSKADRGYRLLAGAVQDAG